MDQSLQITIVVLQRIVRLMYVVFVCPRLMDIFRTLFCNWTTPKECCKRVHEKHPPGGAKRSSMTIVKSTRSATGAPVHAGSGQSGSHACWRGPLGRCRWAQCLMMRAVMSLGLVEDGSVGVAGVSSLVTVELLWTTINCTVNVSIGMPSTMIMHMPRRRCLRPWT